MKFLFFFLVMPALELWLLIEIGSRLGAWYTIGLLFLSALVGIQLIKQQGFSTLIKMNRKLAGGEDPSIEAISGLILALGGLLFFLPGFISDALGLLCLLPPTRHMLARYWLRRIGKGSFVHVHVNRSAAEQEENIIEGEFRREASEDKRLP
jgi:UPF0716 protein FxsA